MDLNQNFTELTDDALASYASEVRSAFDAIAALEAPTEAQVGEAESYADHLDAISTEQDTRVAAATALAERTEALRNRFAKSRKADVEEEDAVDDVDEDEAEDDEADEDELSREAQKISSTPPPDPQQASSGVVTLSRRVKRPAKPAASRAPITITAAADVPEFATGSRMSGLEQVGNGAGQPDARLRHPVRRRRDRGPPALRGGLVPARLPAGTDHRPALRRHGGAGLRGQGGPASRRLAGRGRWLVCAVARRSTTCAPGRPPTGILSVPEVNVARGGIKYTRGPDFASHLQQRRLLPDRGAGDRRYHQDLLSRCPARRSSRSGWTPVGSASRPRS